MLIMFFQKIIKYTMGLKFQWFLTCGKFPTGGEWQSCQVENDLNLWEIPHWWGMAKLPSGE